MTLSQADKKRAKKLRNLIAKLERGEHVQKCRMDEKLTKAEKQQMEDRWNTQLEMRKFKPTKPPEIVEYEKRQLQANFIDNRAEGFSLKKEYKTAQKLRYDAEKLYEGLIEYLEEMLHKDSALVNWFDQHIDFTEIRYTPSPDYATMPRVDTTFEFDMAFGGQPELTKKELKLEVAKEALAKLSDEDQAVPITDEEKEKLKRLLKKIKN